MTYAIALDHTGALPDPYEQPEFYRDVPTKRLFAWIVDEIVICTIVALMVVMTLFTALFILPLVWMSVSFLYRWLTISAGSATPGMRLMALQLRRHDGSRFDGVTALLHTLGYIVSVVTFPLQMISIAMMLLTDRRQGLSDMVLGTAAVNRHIV